MEKGPTVRGIENHPENEYEIWLEKINAVEKELHTLQNLDRDTRDKKEAAEWQNHFVACCEQMASLEWTDSDFHGGSFDKELGRPNKMTYRLYLCLSKLPSLQELSKDERANCLSLEFNATYLARSANNALNSRK